MIENFNDMKNKLVLLGYEVKEFDCNRLNLFSPSGEKVVTIYDSINKDIIIKLPDDADNKVSESGEKKCSTSISMYIQQATGLIDFTIHNVTVIGGNISYIKKLLDGYKLNRLDLSKFNFDNVKEINTMFLLTNISELVLPTMNKANIKGVNELIALCRIGKIIGSFDIDISRADVLANSLGIFHQMTLHSDLDLSGFCPNGRIEVFRGGQIHGKVTFNNYKFNGGRDLKRMLTCLASGAKTIDEIEIPLENLSNYTKEELDDITNETNMIYRYDGDKVRFIYIL